MLESGKREVFEIMKASNWNITVIGGTAGLLSLIAVLTIMIDPFLHYHLPLKGLEYPLLDERYQNDGIARHYTYNAVITGTSMTQNFKPSEFDALFTGTETVKIAFSGASYKEVNDNILRMLKHNSEVKYILRSLDGTLLNMPAEEDTYEGYPEYLFDENPFNDVEYLLNKEVIPKTIAVVNYTRAGNVTTTRDDYGSWSQYKEYGKEAVLRSYGNLEGFEEEIVLSQEDYKNIRENVQKNVLQTALEHPEITFYLFYPPYSICYWDALVQTKQLNAQLEAEKTATGMLMGVENIHVYAFAENIEMISDLDNYTDSLHYGGWINSDILRWIREGKYELTSENYEAYYDRLGELFLNYDYSELHE